MSPGRLDSPAQSGENSLGKVCVEDSQRLLQMMQPLHVAFVAVDSRNNLKWWNDPSPARPAAPNFVFAAELASGVASDVSAMSRKLVCLAIRITGARLALSPGRASHASSTRRKTDRGN